MVMSELTGGVDGLGLLVFLMCSTYGRYIDPDQQGDTACCLSFGRGAPKSTTQGGIFDLNTYITFDCAGIAAF